MTRTSFRFCSILHAVSYFHLLCAVSGASGYNPEQSQKVTIKQRPKHSFISFLTNETRS